MRSGTLASTSARRSSLLLAAAGLTGSWSSCDYLAGGGGGFAVSSNAAWSPGALFVSAVSVSSSSAASGHPASSSPSSRILRTAVDIEGEQDQDDDSFSSSRAGPPGGKVVDEAVTFTQKDVGSGTAAKLQREGSTTTSRKVAPTATIRKATATAARTGAPLAPSSSVQQQVETSARSNPKTGKSRSHDTTRLVRRTAASSSTSEKSNTRERQEEQKEKKEEAEAAARTRAKTKTTSRARNSTSPSHGNSTSPSHAYIVRGDPDGDEDKWQGEGTGCGADGTPKLNNKTARHGVRCCGRDGQIVVEDGGGTWKYRPDSWYTADGGGGEVDCMTADDVCEDASNHMTWNETTAHCAAMGRRPCRLDEILMMRNDGNRRLCANTGGICNRYCVWTATEEHGLAAILATASSEYGGHRAEKLIDGVFTSLAHTSVALPAANDTNGVGQRCPWWQLDLGATKIVNKVKLSAEKSFERMRRLLFGRRFLDSLPTSCQFSSINEYFSELRRSFDKTTSSCWFSSIN